MRVLPIVALALIALAGTRASAQGRKPQGQVILERAIAKEKQAGALEEALRELDALIGRNAKDADAHYARGWVLSRLGKDEAAVAAYDRAFELERTLADAAYNAGVVLGKLGKSDEALGRFERALLANPRHVDAAFNAGQAYYDAREYWKAAARWKQAAAVAPDDFQIAKKLVQAYVALGDDGEVSKARDRVFALWRAAKDPSLLKMKSYVYDQFELGKYRVVVYEAFDTSGDLAYVYQFAVTEAGKVLGSVNLESSSASREKGFPFVLGLDKGGKHATLRAMWKDQPTYRLARAAATTAIQTNF